MADLIGGKKKYELIDAPIGKKINGKVVEVARSQKIDGYISIKVEFPQFFKSLDNGVRFNKQVYYGIPIDWSEKNKAGVLYQNLCGKFPDEDEAVNWTKILLGKKVSCILENANDKITGAITGHRISWMGADWGSKTADSGIEISKEELEPDEDVPF